MANDKNTTNKLVADDLESTAEIEATTIRRAESGKEALSKLEMEEATFEFQGSGSELSASTDRYLHSELQSSIAANERLQYDFEQLRSRWRGLEAELETRTRATRELSDDLGRAQKEILRLTKQLSERDKQINTHHEKFAERDKEIAGLRDLISELRATNNDLASGNEITTARRQLVENEGEIAGLRAEYYGLIKQQQKTETYADQLRRELSDFKAEATTAISQHASLTIELKQAESRIAQLENRLVDASRAVDETSKALAEAQEEHAKEVRMLRFELGEAQETIEENSRISERLAFDLVENQSYKSELERMLTSSESRSQTKIDTLEKQIAELEESVADSEAKIEARGETINSLLNELAKRGGDDADETGENVEPSGAVEEVVMRPQASGERVTRLLIGKVGDQELRFPLFKNRLTIGRTQQNDIYLNAQYISRRHAVVVTEGDTTRIIDWGSKNGIYVNSKRVTEHFLKSGDKVAIGTVEFRYEELPKRDS